MKKDGRIIRVIEPNPAYMDIVNMVLSAALPVFDNWLMSFYNPNHPHRIPCADPEVLSDVLNQASPDELHWIVSTNDDEPPIVPYIDGAHASPGKIDVLLNSESIEDDWNSNIFIISVCSVLKHEFIHFEQYKRMHPLSLLQPSGYTRSMKTDGTIDMKIYLSDPQEIMAHASDMADEISRADDPNVAIRDPEGFLDFIPTWSKYRKAGFLRKDRVIKRLLKETTRYALMRGYLNGI